MRFQQDLARFDVAVVVLRPRRKILSDLLDLVPEALATLPAAPRGEATPPSSAMVRNTIDSAKLN